ncbi:hypothetical protein ES703_16674 [subsurface metagenome]
MTTADEGKGSVLKTKLGLENLKGLGDTLKQIKEVTEVLGEAQKTIGEMSKNNSPLGMAIARTIEDNINVSEEVRKTMQEDLKNKEKTIEELEAENKGLKEDKVVREVADTVREELDKRLPQSGNQGNNGGQGKLMSALEKVVADYMEKRLLGGGEGTLTGEQIRSIVKDEVGAGAGGNKKPEDMVEDLVNALTMGDRLREKLGGAGLGGRLLQAPGGGSELRTDLVKALLEDERERLKIQQNHEVETQRNQHLGTLATTVKENLSDGIAALSAAAKEIKEGTGAKTSASESKPKLYDCGDCHFKFSLPAEWVGQPIKCPNCGREYSKEELMA